MTTGKRPGLPISATSPVRHCGPPPGRADAVIVGGGVIGVATALYLARKGLRPVVLEKGRVAAEQSARNWGWIRQTGRDLAEIPIVIEAQSLWTELAAQIGDGLGLRRSGLSYLAETEAELARHERWLAGAREHGVDSRLLGRAETARLLPGAARRFAGALHTPADMTAEPWTAVPLIAGLAEAEGAVIVESCAARVIDIAAGRVAGVMTEQGLIVTDTVVVAGGAWSSLFLRRHGVSIPQLSVLSNVCATERLPQVAAGGVATGNLAFRPRADGGYTLAPSGFHEFRIGPDAFRQFPHYLPMLWREPFGRRYGLASPSGFPDGWGTSRRWDGDSQTPFERMRVLNPHPTPGKTEAAAQRFGDFFPDLGEVRIKAAWAGMIDAMPDVVPVVDHAPGLPGLTICTGMCGHGFGIGPAFGRITADLVTGGAAGHDLHRFRFGRFTDGSRLELGPGL